MTDQLATDFLSFPEAPADGEALTLVASDTGSPQALKEDGRAGRRREPVEGKPTPRDKWGRVTVELPGYVIYALKERALRNGCSVRHLVMKALRTQNFRILDADMSEDARKANGRKSGA